MSGQKVKPSRFYQLKFFLLFNPWHSLVGISICLGVLFLIGSLFETYQVRPVAFMGYLCAYLLFYLSYRSRCLQSLFQIMDSFNQRYCKLNQHLANQEAEKDKFQDYINLCAEEYFFYINGQIPEAIWEVWFAGMKEAWENNKRFAQEARDQFPEQSDQKFKLYYGFNPYELGLLEKSNSSEAEDIKDRNCA